MPNYRDGEKISEQGERGKQGVHVTIQGQRKRDFFVVM